MERISSPTSWQAFALDKKIKTTTKKWLLFYLWPIQAFWLLLFFQNDHNQSCFNSSPIPAFALSIFLKRPQTMKVVQAFSLLIFLKQPQTKFTYKLNLLPVMGLHAGHNFSNDRKVIASCFYQWPIQAFALLIFSKRQWSCWPHPCCCWHPWEAIALKYQG